MSQYSVTIERFDGGLNTKATPLHGSSDQSPNLQNVIFDDSGAVETRRGYQKFNTAAIASAPIDFLHSYNQNNGTRELLVSCNGDLYKATNVTAGSFDLLESSHTTGGARVLGVTFQNKVFMTNGYTPPTKYDGTSVTRWGVPPLDSIGSPDLYLTAATGAGLSGVYRYVFCGVNAYGVISDISSQTTWISATSEAIRINHYNSFPASSGVQNILICRNTAGVQDDFYVVTQVANGTDEVVDDNPDAYLVDYAPLDNGLPQNFTCMVLHQGRVFAASSTSSDPMFLYYSNIDDPEIFPSDSIIRVGEGDGYPITGLAVLTNAVIISKNDGRGNGSLYLLYTPDANPDNWSLTKLDTESSTQSAKVMINFSNYIAFLNKYGVFDLNQQAVGTVKSDALSYNIEPDIYALATDYLSKATAITWKNKVWISVPYTAAFEATQTTNNRVYQYDYVRGRQGTDREYGSWSRHTNHSISEFAIHDGALYGGSSTDGFVYQLDTGYNDAGTAIDSSYQTMAIVGKPEHQNYTKTWRFCYVTVECSGDWNMSLAYSNDFKDEIETTTTVSLDPEITLWDDAILGTDLWGAGLLRKRVQVVFRNSTSKAIQLKFSTNTADQYFKVYKVEVFYNLRGLR
jgi:hypothetical protein